MKLFHIIQQRDMFYEEQSSFLKPQKKTSTAEEAGHLIKSEPIRTSALSSCLACKVRKHSNCFLCISFSAPANRIPGLGMFRFACNYTHSCFHHAMRFSKHISMHHKKAYLMAGMEITQRLDNMSTSPTNHVCTVRSVWDVVSRLCEQQQKTTIKT